MKELRTGKNSFAPSRKIWQPQNCFYDVTKELLHRTTSTSAELCCWQLQTDRKT